MKRAIALLFACLFLFCACAAPEPSVQDTAKTEENAPRYTLEAVPGLTADTIDYWQSKDVNYTCFILEQNGKFGSIDKSGATVSAPLCGKIGLVLYTLLNDGAQKGVGLFACDGEYLGNDGYYVASDGRFVADSQMGRGMDGYCAVYWTDEGPKMITQDYMGDPYRLSAFSLAVFRRFAAAKMLYSYKSYAGKGDGVNAIPVQKAESFTSSQGMGGTNYEPVLASEKYGLFDLNTGAMLTDFIYDEASWPIDGVLCVRVGDKCGYITETGESLTAIDLDCADAYEGSDWSLEKGTFTRTFYEFYQAVNGCIVTIRNGKYGLMKADGTEVVENRFDYLSQAGPDGVFWAKEGSTWYRGEAR